MFKSNLRVLMAEKGIDKDTQLADLTGINRITIKRIKNNEISQISLKVASKLMIFFNLTKLDELWTYIPDK